MPAVAVRNHGGHKARPTVEPALPLQFLVRGKLRAIEVVKPGAVAQRKIAYMLQHELCSIFRGRKRRSIKIHSRHIFQ